MSEPPELISAKGLAARYGVTRAYVRILLDREGAPAPVEVEGGVRESVYDLRDALPFMDKQLDRRG
ncbi:hypothetical protein ACFQ6C_26590 [Streptomyces sp. NPDC056454]|uniref:hypothetical protein n=1 Tax=Streptomyces sp. NPDC056454 TaxID=3345823 RepID=UPI00369A0200